MPLDDLSAMVGKRLLVGITYVSASGDVDERVEFSGVVAEVEPLISIDRGDGGEPFTLPPEPEAYDRASPGEYTLRMTGEVVSNPDFVTTWTVTAPK